MISDALKEMLIAQVGHELAASHHYLASSVYFAGQDLEGWADAFYAQSAEERDHALKIVKFLVDLDISFSVPAIGAASSEFASPAAVIEAALASERKVTAQFQAMAVKCMEVGDFTAFEFIQWFIREQVEEEQLMRRYLAMANSGADMFLLQSQLGDSGHH